MTSHSCHVAIQFKTTSPLNISCSLRPLVPWCMHNDAPYFYKTGLTKPEQPTTSILKLWVTNLDPTYQKLLEQIESTKTHSATRQLLQELMETYKKCFGLMRIQNKIVARVNDVTPVYTAGLALGQHFVFINNRLDGLSVIIRTNLDWLGHLV